MKINFAATLKSFFKGAFRIVKNIAAYALKHPIIAIVALVLVFAGSISLFNCGGFLRRKNPSESRISVAQILKKSDLVAMTIDYDIYVDSTRAASFGGSTISRIYHANVLLGFNLADVKITRQNKDTICLQIPEIKPLNNNGHFVNEVNFKNVIEDQSINMYSRIDLSGAAKPMAAKANRIVLQNLKDDNAYEAAAQAARHSLQNLLYSFGYYAVFD